MPVTDQTHSQRRHYAVSPLLGGIEMLEAVYDSHQFSPHSQEAAVIGVVENGGAVVFGAGETLQLGVGSVLVIPPHILHDARMTSTVQWRYRALYLTTRQLEAVLPDAVDGDGVLGTRPFVLDRSDVAEHVVETHGLLRRTTTSRDAADGALVELQNLLRALHLPSTTDNRRASSERRTAGGVVRARRVMDEDPLHKRSLSELAEIANLNRFTFAHAFSQAYGVSPHQYALQRRIAAVRELLAAGELVSRAAHHVGFADQSHLTRRFISVVGVTPGEFRRAWQQHQLAI